MSPELSAALIGWRRLLRKRWLKKGKEMPSWVFPSLDGTALEARNVRHVFARMLAKAGLRKIRLHDLRHNTASLLLQAGAPITYVAQQLGHRDASTTLRVYAHYLPDDSRRDVALLDGQPPATPAQPAGSPSDGAESGKCFGLSGEPRRNRTYNPQIKSLLLCQLS
jgi:integrase